jgi:hypothetical protein
MAAGFGYTALVIDAFAGRIVGWECSLSKHTASVDSAIRQAAALRRRQGHPLAGGTIHHRRRIAVHRGALRRNPPARRADPLHRHRGRRAGQRPDQDHHRAVQGRVRARRLAVPARTHRHAGRPPRNHLGLGALVQHQSTHAPSGSTPTSRKNSPPTVCFAYSQASWLRAWSGALRSSSRSIAFTWVTTFSRASGGSPSGCEYTSTPFR